MALVMAGQVQPPLAGMEEHQEGATRLEEQFSSILACLMSDEIDAAGAVQAFERASTAATQQYREDASGMLHRPAHHLHMHHLAAEMEAQAASWQLLKMLYCTGDTPAGVLVGAEDVGGRPTLRQMTADVVNNDRDLRRFAQVVMWLESLAAQKLSNAPPSRFAQNEGVWRATLLTAPRGSQDPSSPAVPDLELDPDAPSRDKLRLADMDRRAEERLAEQLWQLIRAGKAKEARELCCQAGQAWRSLSLAAGGDWGPLPVGPAAGEAADTLDQQAAADDLAWEVEGGAAAGRVAWKWACYAAAEAAGNAHEGAVYGALCGHIKRMLPVCSSWEDEAWAYCRASLELQADYTLLARGTGSEAEPDALSMMMGTDPDGPATAEAQVAPELLEGVVALAAKSGYSNATNMQLLHDGLSVMAGDWPMKRMVTDDDQPCIPRDFQELGTMLFRSAKAVVSGSASQQQHLLQLYLMSEDWVSMVTQLRAASMKAEEQLEQQQRRRRLPPGRAAAADAAAGDDAMEADDNEDDTSQAAAAAARGGGGYAGGISEAAEDSSGGGGMSQQSAVDLLRFTAHWALVLRALGLLPASRWVAEDEAYEAQLAMLQHELNKVIFPYALLLAKQPTTLSFVPLYLCNLRLTERKVLAQTLLQQATQAYGGDDTSCQELFDLLAAATEVWYQRQEQLNSLLASGWQVPGLLGAGPDADQGPEGMGGAVKLPRSYLFGDLRWA